MRARNVLRQVAWTELALGLRRFAFWFIAAVFAFLGWFYFTRYVSVSPGEDSLTQGVKLGRNSAYSLSMMLAVLGFNLVGDGLRDALDPRATRRG